MTKPRWGHWSPEEERVIGRYVRRLLADRSLSAQDLSRPCATELRKVRPERAPVRTHWAAYTRLCERLRAAGRMRTAGRDRWTTAEMRLLERFARATVEGRYRSVLKATPELRRELLRLEPGRERFVARTLIGVQGRLNLRVAELGRSSAKAPWSQSEQRVLERYARSVLNGEYLSVRSAVADFRRALDPHRRRVGPGRRQPAPPRTERAVRLRLQEAVRGLAPDRPTMSEMRWTPQELRIMDRYALKVATGFYPTAPAATRECYRELLGYARATHRRVRRSKSAVRRFLSDRIRGLKLPPSGRHWTAEEERVVDRHARALADGRLRDAMAAAELCTAELNRLRHRYPSRYRVSYVRKVHTVHGRLWPRAARLRYPWSHTKWTSAEQQLAERYARAAIAHEYPNLMAAARACSEELAGLDTPARRPGSTTAAPIRLLHSVHDALVKRTRKMNWRRLPYRVWNEEELRIAGPLVQKYILHRKGRLVAGLVTLGPMLQADLDRHGYYRGLQACKMHLIMSRMERLGVYRTRRIAQRLR
jgi:hypothetical protein